MALAVDLAPPPSSLAPGFRFHPTDEELVRYYLRRKVCGKSFRFDAISDVDVYKVEPWDLPDLSRLKSRDLEWYFFSALDKKYGNGSRTNRATEKGYWKTTGKDREVHHKSQKVGMKKTLVYHSGRAPKGERTNWVMHEYRLIDQELEKAGIVQDAFVLCRIFRKSGPGPKNGEKFGAPFIEEEWEDDDSVFVPKQEDIAEEFPVDEDSYLDANDIEQILNTDLPREDVPLPLNFQHGDNDNHADASATVTQNLSVGGDEFEPQSDKSDGSKLQAGLDSESINHEHIEEPSNNMNFDIDYLLDEPYFDATTGDLPFDESLFFDANDFKNTAGTGKDTETDYGLDMLNEYTSFFNPDIDDFPFTFDSIGGEDILPNSFLTLENVNDETHPLNEGSQPIGGQKDDISPSKQGHPDPGADTAHSFLKKASYMLENIPSPPAFASEFPTKYMASGSQASSSVNFTSGMIRISNVSFNGGAVDLSLGKHTQLNIVLSFGPGQRPSPYQAGKARSRSWFYSAFLWILVLSLSFKIGSLVCPRSFMS